MDDPPGPTPPALPDLRISPKEAVATDTGWQLTYTVRNDGIAASGPFKVTVARSGGSESQALTEPGLDPQASRTRTATLARSSCYAAFRVVADSTQVVSEIAESNNESWTVGQASAVCDDGPRHTVRALELEALRTQESADEAYVVVSMLGAAAAQTRVSPVLQGMVPGRRVATRGLCGCIEFAAPAGIGLSAQVLENDHVDLLLDDNDPGVARDILNNAIRSVGPLTDPLSSAGWVASAVPTIVDGLDYVESRVDDDAIGSATVAHSAPDLARRLDQPGASFEQTLGLAGAASAGDAFYHVKVRVARVR